MKVPNLTFPIFSSNNRIDLERVRRAVQVTRTERLCFGCFGYQTDIQCMGYDHLCGLAVCIYELFLEQGFKSGGSEYAVYYAQREVRESPYSKGFQLAWDLTANSSRLKSIKSMETARGNAW